MGPWETLNIQSLTSRNLHFPPGDNYSVYWQGEGKVSKHTVGPVFQVPWVTAPGNRAERVVLSPGVQESHQTAKCTFTVFWSRLSHPNHCFLVPDSGEQNPSLQSRLWGPGVQSPVQGRGLGTSSPLREPGEAR